MGENAKSLAIVNAAGRVVTFVRLDTSSDWNPPDGHTAIPDDELPPGWLHAEETAPVPQSIAARQIRLWLVSRGIGLAAVEAAIDSIQDAKQRDMVRVEWEYAPYVERSHSMLVPLAAALGMDEAAVDQAFREAANL